MLYIWLLIACTDDIDGDGFVVTEDCDDSNVSSYPGAAEVCDGLDNDCDGVVDEFVGTLLYLDHDQDGFGDDNEAVYSCDGAAENYAEIAGDCDDDNPDIYPHAPEVCDGRDSDCDPLTHAEYGVSWFDGSGTMDVSSYFSPGTTEAPIEYLLSDPGELRFCGGPWYTLFHITADVTLRGEGGYAHTLLSGAENGAVLTIYDNADVLIQGLSLVEGSGVEYNGQYSGGGVACQNASVRIEDSRIAYNEADYGGGLFLQNCDIEVSQSVIEHNHARAEGGGLYLFSGAFRADESRLQNNSANNGGGGACSVEHCSISLQNSRVAGNHATYNGAGLYMRIGELNARKSAFFENRTTGAGGAIAANPFLGVLDIEITDTYLEENDAYFGGAISVFPSEYDYHIMLKSQWDTTTVRRNHSDLGGAIAFWWDQDNPPSSIGALTLQQVNMGSPDREDDNILSDLWFQYNEQAFRLEDDAESNCTAQGCE